MDGVLCRESRCGHRPSHRWIRPCLDHRAVETLPARLIERRSRDFAGFGRGGMAGMARSGPFPTAFNDIHRNPLGHTETHGIALAHSPCGCVDSGKSSP